MKKINKLNQLMWTAFSPSRPFCSRMNMEIIFPLHFSLLFSDMVSFIGNCFHQHFSSLYRVKFSLLLSRVITFLIREPEWLCSVHYFLVLCALQAGNSLRCKSLARAQRDSSSSTG
jgi:hypothetical protein